jgi:hypothetical protein
MYSFSFISHSFIHIYYSGSFGGTYFRPIKSAVTGRSYSSEEALADLPREWFRGLDEEELVTSEE